MQTYHKTRLIHWALFSWFCLVIILSILKITFQVDPIHDGTFYSSGFALNKNLLIYKDIATSYGPITHLFSAMLINFFGTSLMIHRIGWLVLQLFIALISFRLLMIKLSFNKSFFLAISLILLDPNAVGISLGYVNASRYWPNQIIVLVSLVVVLLVYKILSLKHNLNFLIFSLGAINCLFPFIRAQSSIISIFITGFVLYLSKKNPKSLFYFLFGTFVGLASLMTTLSKYMDFGEFIKQTLILPLDPSVPYSKFDSIGTARFLVIVLISISFFYLVFFTTKILTLSKLRISYFILDLFFTLIVFFLAWQSIQNSTLNYSYKDPYFLILTLVRGSGIAFTFLLLALLLYFVIKALFENNVLLDSSNKRFIIFALLMLFFNMIAIYPKFVYLPYLLPLTTPLLFILPFLTVYKDNFFVYFYKFALVSTIATISATSIHTSYSYQSHNLELIRSSNLTAARAIDKEISFLNQLDARSVVWGPGCYELMSAITGKYLPIGINYGPDIPYPPKKQVGKLNLSCDDNSSKSETEIVKSNADVFALITSNRILKVFDLN